MTERAGKLATAEKGARSLWVFFAMSAALTWIVWLWPVSNRSYLHLVFHGGWALNWPLNNAKLLIGNALPGLLALMWASVEGGSQRHELLTSLLAWKTRIRWYILAVTLPFGVLVPAMGAVLIHFSEEPNRPHLIVLVNSLIALPFGPLWEEVAWRAFGLRKLQLHYSRLLSALIIGFYWAVWHIPLWLLTLNYLTPTLLLIICVNLVSWSVTFAFLYDRSGQSLPVVIVLHVTLLTVQNFVFAAVPRGTIYIIPVATALSICLAAFLARCLTGDGGAPPSSGWLQITGSSANSPKCTLIRYRIPRSSYFPMADRAHARFRTRTHACGAGAWGAYSLPSCSHPVKPAGGWVVS